MGYEPPKSKKTLAGVIGSIAGAAALFVMIPAEESGRTVAATVGKDGSISVKHIAGKQYLTAYLDLLGVATACDGITKGVKTGMKFTEAQCAVKLEEELIAHAEPVIKCMPSLYGRTNQVVPAVSLSFNIGTAGVCQSSIRTLWNAGKWRAGCERFPLFNKGRIKGVLTPIPGLTNRRARERRFCLVGLAA